MKIKFLTHCKAMFKHLISLVLILLAVVTVHAQGEWKWANYWTGNDDPLDSNNPYNYVVRTAFDDDGNVYVFGSFGGSARIQDQTLSTWIFDNVEVVASNTSGIILVKFDSLGNHLWSRVIKNSKQGEDCRPYDMALRDGKIVISGHYSFDYNFNEQLWFLDTLVTQQTALSYPFGECHPPYTFTGGYISFVSILDLDGNVLESHFVKTLSRNTENRQILPLNTGIGSCPMCMDSDGYLYIATGISYGGPDTLPWTVVLDEDTNRMYDFYLPGRDDLSAIHNMMIFKFSPTFDLEWTKLIVEHTEGLSPYIPIDTVNPHFTPRVFGMSVDSDNNLYLSGYLMDMWMTDQYNQYPIRIYWDSAHFAIVDDYGLAFYMPFIIKYNSNGNVLWSNQAFVRNPPENSLPNAISWMDNYVHNNSVYLVGCTGHFDGTNATYYFDNMNNVLNVSQSTTYFVRFNKNTGGYENSGAVPGNKTNVSYGDPIKPAVINNHLMHMTRNNMIDNNYHLLCYYNTDGTFQRADTIYHLYSFLAGGQNVVVNQHGQILCDFINKQDLSFGNDFALDFTDNQHFHAVVALRYDPSILEPYPEDTTGVALYTKTSVRIYPNPTSNTLYIESADATIDHIVVLDLTGKEILRQDIFNNRGEINVSSLPNGIYLVKTICKGGCQINKFIKSDF